LSSEANEAPPTAVLGLGIGAFLPPSVEDLYPWIDGAFQMPWLDGKLGTRLALGYWQMTKRVGIQNLAGGDIAVTAANRALLLDLQVTYRMFSWQSLWSPHAGAGPLLYLLSTRVEGLGHTNVESFSVWGVLVALGIDLHVGPGAVVFEVQMPLIAHDDRLSTDLSVDKPSLALGYRFRI
jgi:hypothetical protein